MDAPAAAAAHAAEAEDDADADAGAEEVILLLALVVEEAELPTAKNPSSLQHHGSSPVHLWGLELQHQHCHGTGLCQEPLLVAATDRDSANTTTTHVTKYDQHCFYKSCKLRAGHSNFPYKLGIHVLALLSPSCSFPENN